MRETQRSDGLAIVANWLSIDTFDRFRVWQRLLLASHKSPPHLLHSDAQRAGLSTTVSEILSLTTIAKNHESDPLKRTRSAHGRTLGHRHTTGRCNLNRLAARESKEGCARTCWRMRGNRREHVAQPSVRAVQWGADVGAVGETGWRYGRQRGVSPRAYGHNESAHTWFLRFRRLRNRRLRFVDPSAQNGSIPL